MENAGLSRNGRNEKWIFGYMTAVDGGKDKDSGHQAVGMGGGY